MDLLYTCNWIFGPTTIQDFEIIANDTLVVCRKWFDAFKAEAVTKNFSLH